MAIKYSECVKVPAEAIIWVWVHERGDIDIDVRTVIRVSKEAPGTGLELIKMLAEAKKVSEEVKSALEELSDGRA